MERREDNKAPNEVWVTGITPLGAYLTYISSLFEDKYDKIILKAMGYAISKVLELGILVRKKFKGIHQIAEMQYVTISGQEGNREVGQVVITISKKELDKNHIGYTGPLPDSEVQEYHPFERVRRGRGRGGYRDRTSYYQNDRGYYRARGRGRFGRGNARFAPRRFRSYY